MPTLQSPDAPKYESIEDKLSRIEELNGLLSANVAQAKALTAEFGTLHGERYTLQCDLMNLGYIATTNIQEVLLEHAQTSNS